MKASVFLVCCVLKWQRNVSAILFSTLDGGSPIDSDQCALVSSGSRLWLHPSPCITLDSVFLTVGYAPKVKRALNGTSDRLKELPFCLWQHRK